MDSSANTGSRLSPDDELMRRDEIVNRHTGGRRYPANKSAGPGFSRIAVRGRRRGDEAMWPAVKLRVTTAPSPTPTVTSLSPGTVKVNGPAFTLTVNGTNFVNGTSIVRWNGSNRPTTFVSATQLTAAIPASDITTTGDKFIRVANGSLVSAPAVKLKVTP